MLRIFRTSFRGRILSNKGAECHVMEGFTAQPLVGIGDGIVRGEGHAIIELPFQERNLGF